MANDLNPYKAMVRGTLLFDKFSGFVAEINVALLVNFLQWRRYTCYFVAYVTSNVFKRKHA